MRRFWVIALLSMMLAPASITAKTRPFRLGAEAGLDLNKMSVTTNSFKTENRTGWFFGPKIDVKIPIGHLGLDASLLYNKKLISAYQLSETQKLSYVVVPLNLHYRIGVRGASVIIATGPQWNWYIGNSDKLSELTSNYELHDITYSEHAVLKHSYASWNIGAQLEVLEHLQIGMNYCIGLGESMESETSGETRALRNAFTGKNHAFQVRLGFLF